MARSTWEGCSDPDVQAEPEDAQISELIHEQENAFAFDKLKTDICRIRKTIEPVAVHSAVGIVSEFHFQACREAL